MLLMMPSVLTKTLNTINSNSPIHQELMVGLAWTVLPVQRALRETKASKASQVFQAGMARMGDRGFQGPKESKDQLASQDTQALLG